MKKKYYVGYSNNFIQRIEQHFNKCGSKWTTMYPVIKVIKIQEGTKKDELNFTREMMAQHGIDNVRGGPWCSIILNENPFNKYSKLYGDHINNRCFKCGRNGHYAADCYSKYELRCNKCGKRGHYANICYRRYGKNGHFNCYIKEKTECFKCGESGHYSSDCNATDESICIRCGERGHYACYIKERNEIF